MLAVSLAVSGCAAPLLIGAAGTTVVKASEERGLTGAFDDAAIHTAISELWFKADLDLYQRMNLTVDDGRALVTGRAATPDQRVNAIRLVWQADGVKEVINDVTVDNQSTVLDSARDSWISTKLRAALLLDSGIHSTNYSIDVVNGVVYLMGVARSRQELNAVVAHAKSLARVQGVVSHVRLL